MIYLGIDPGKSGGIAIVGDGKCHAFKMPDTDFDIFEAITEAGASMVILEKVHSSPQMGVVSAFKFGASFGALKMACVAARCRVELVSPQKWQKAMSLKAIGKGIGQGDTAKKNRNKAKAQELFPQVKKITHATADALLLAEYGRRTFGGEI